MSYQPQDSIEPSHFSPDVLEFIRLLSGHKVQYVVVGGEAVIYHGYPRFTGDIDFFFSDDDPNIRALFAALQEFWSGNIPGIESAEELAEPGVIIQFGRPPNRIDLLNRIDAVPFQDAWKDKINVRIIAPGSEMTLFMLDLRNLLRNKRASARPKDLDDVRVLGAAVG
jgi:hypothetical protein